MNLPQYRRSASVTIGKVGGQGKTLSGLKITFTIVKTEDKDPNTAKIEIYNLSRNTRDLIKENGEFIVVNAGYLDGDGEELLFIGNITAISHDLVKPTVITTIDADDGSNALFDSRISLSHEAGVKGITVLNNILNTIPLTNNIKVISIPDKAYANGFSFAGISKKALTKVTEFLELNWSVQNNEIVLIPFDGNDKTRAVHLSASTGMIGSPARVTLSTRKSKKISKKDKSGWKVISLLQPKILPTGKIAISSTEIPANTVFTVINVTHTGDTFGRDWFSSIEVKE